MYAIIISSNTKTISKETKMNFTAIIIFILIMSIAYIVKNITGKKLAATPYYVQQYTVTTIHIGCVLLFWGTISTSAMLFVGFLFGFTN